MCSPRWLMMLVTKACHRHPIKLPFSKKLLVSLITPLSWSEACDLLSSLSSRTLSGATSPVPDFPRAEGQSEMEPPARLKCAAPYNIPLLPRRGSRSTTTSKHFRRHHRPREVLATWRLALWVCVVYFSLSFWPTTPAAHDAPTSPPPSFQTLRHDQSDRCGTGTGRPRAPHKTQRRNANTISGAWKVTCAPASPRSTASRTCHARRWGCLWIAQ